ncbi:MAG: hypothetical protein AAF754_13295 [Pseudomonadota bacterium]
MITCLGTASLAQTDEFRKATKVAQIKKMGAQQISGDSIRKIVSGRTLDHPGWTWIFKADGTQTSADKKGQWNTSGTWRIDGNLLCRKSDQTGKEKCSDVYFLGRDLKFTLGGKRNLEEWFATY